MGYIFCSFDSEWSTYGEGSESLLWLVFSPLMNVNGKVIQKVLNHYLSSILFTFESERQTYAKGSKSLIFHVSFSLLKQIGKLMQKVLKH